MSAGSIGLNESKLGIVAPPWLGQQYIDTIGHRQAELALLLGTLFNPTQALEIGLVDEVIEDDDVVAIAKQRASQWVQIPPQARVGTKELTRGLQIAKMLENREQDKEQFCSFVTQGKVQKSLGLYLDQMKKRKSK